MTVSGLDVSSYQPTDLTALIQQYAAQHVVVRLYQDIESPPQSHSLDQIASVLANGCTVGVYMWLYGDIAVAQQVQSALSICPPDAPIVWVDCELYGNSHPTQVQALEAVQRIESAGLRAGIYTGDWFVEGYWGDYIGGLADRAAWLAVYNGNNDLNITSKYWPYSQIYGHQYRGTPVDLDCFDEAVTMITIPAPPGPEPPMPDCDVCFNNLGVATYNIHDGLVAEANRKSGPRKSQILAIADQLAALRIS